jgi:hypothetical protein
VPPPGAGVNFPALAALAVPDRIGYVPRVPSPKPPEPPAFALPRGGRPRASWRFPALVTTALVMTVVGGFVVKARLERDPMAGIPPATRAEMSVRAAEEALAEGALPKAEGALTEALAHLDAALEAAPGDVTLARARLAVVDRQAQLAVRQDQPMEAVRFAKRAMDQALDIRVGAPEDPRSSVDALATTHAYADRAEAARVPVEDVRRALLATADSVGQGPAATRPEVAVVLARTFMRAATLPGAPADVAARAFTAAATAADHAPPGPEALSVLAAAADAAEKQGDLPGARALDTRARALAERLVAERPTDPGAARLLEARLVAAADRAERANDRAAAGTALQAVVTSRRARLSRVDPSYAADTRRELARALSNLGAFWSAGAETREALPAYEEAVALSATLTGEGRRTHLVALGNLAVLQGKLELWTQARDTAARAAELAHALTQDLAAGDAEALDEALAALRHARFLRAPGGDRAKAREVATAALARLDKHFPAGRPAAQTDARLSDARTGLQSLLQELR